MRARSNLDAAPRVDIGDHASIPPRDQREVDLAVRPVVDRHLRYPRLSLFVERDLLRLSLLEERVRKSQPSRVAKFRQKVPV